MISLEFYASNKLSMFCYSSHLLEKKQKKYIFFEVQFNSNKKIYKYNHKKCLSSKTNIPFSFEDNEINCGQRNFTNTSSSNLFMP